MRNMRATVIRLDFIVNWHVSIQISFEVSLCFKLLVCWRVFIEDLFGNERRKGKFSSMDRLGQ